MPTRWAAGRSGAGRRRSARHRRAPRSARNSRGVPSTRPGMPRAGSSAAGVEDARVPERLRRGHRLGQREVEPAEGSKRHLAQAEVGHAPPPGQGSHHGRRSASFIPRSARSLGSRSRGARRESLPGAIAGTVAAFHPVARLVGKTAREEGRPDCVAVAQYRLGGRRTPASANAAGLARPPPTGNRDEMRQSGRRATAPNPQAWYGKSHLC